MWTMGIINLKITRKPVRLNILNTNFDTYGIPRFSWLPEIETILVEDNGVPSLGRRRAAHYLCGCGDCQVCF